MAAILEWMIISTWNVVTIQTSMVYTCMLNYDSIFLQDWVMNLVVIVKTHTNRETEYYKF